MFFPLFYFATSFCKSARWSSSEHRARLRILHGNQFTALDIVFGYNMECVFSKREWFAEELPNLKEYYLRLRQERPLYKKGFEEPEERFLL